jgi:2-phosphoglycerate kinase
MIAQKIDRKNDRLTDRIRYLKEALPNINFLQKVEKIVNIEDLLLELATLMNDIGRKIKRYLKNTLGLSFR